MLDSTPLVTKTERISLRRWLLRAVCGLALLGLCPLTAHATGESDIALFSSTNSAPPNIMLLLDDSTSMTDQPSWCPDGYWTWWGWVPGDADCREKWKIMRDAAIDLIETLNPPDGAGGYAENVRFGAFSFDDGSDYGGILLEPILDDNTANVIDAIDGTALENTSGKYTPLGLTLVDIGRYFAGSAGWGTGGNALPDFGSINQYDGSSEPSVTSPMDLSCRQSFVIALSDGEGQPSAGAKYPNANLWKTLGDADGDGAETQNTDEEWFDDAAYEMYRHDFAPGVSGTQNITLHTIAFDLDGAGATLLETAAENGGGTYHEADESVDLSSTFLAAAANIFASLGSFTGASVTASRTEKGDLFINSWFEPTDDALWAGHVEAYRVAPDGEIQGLDRSGATPVYVPALDANGQIVAPPIWDAGEQILDNSSRRIITADSSYNAAPINVTTGNISDAELTLTAGDPPVYPNYPGSGIDTVSELKTALIDYVYGKDAFDEDGDGSKTNLRDPMLGDVFHSTPLMIGPPTTSLAGEAGYSGFLASYGLRDRVVYAGANDALLHAFDAGEYLSGDDPWTTETEDGYYSFGTGVDGVNGGEELWGYLPRQLLDDLKFLPVNSPRLAYYVDGSPTAAEAWLGDKAGGTAKVKDANEWATVLVTGLRGTPGYVALDVTDPSSASYPSVLWEFTDSKLGEAWSRPVITRVKIAESAGYGDYCGSDDGDGDCREQWVAIFGGGYMSNANPNDSDFGPTTASANWTDRSKSIYVVALDTGDVLAKVVYDENGVNGPDEMLYALPGSPAVLDLDFDGFADVVYIGDAGGQMWKWDISAIGTLSSGEVTNWPVGIFFQTPATDLGSGNFHYRSFFSTPAASYVDDVLTLAFGSGERENLFYGGTAAYSENNRFYVIKDFFPTGTGAFSTTKTEADADITDVTDGSNLPGNSGYYIQVPDGEKFVSSPTVFAGYVIATSFQPEPGSDPCVSGAGQAYLYVFGIDDGVGYFDDGTADVEADRRLLIGSGMPSSPKVTAGGNPDDDVIYIKTSTGQIIEIDPPPRPDPKAELIYWRQVF